jgi:hypothetical protein
MGRAGSRRAGPRRAGRLVAGLLLAGPLLAAPPLAGPLAGQAAPVEAMILSPEPGERVGPEQVLVAVSFVDRDAALEPGSIVLRVGGRDVTAEARVTAELVTWRPATPLLPGPHGVRLSARTRDGVEVPAAAWTFTVAPGPMGPGPGPDAAAAGDRAGGPAGVPGWARVQGSITFEGSGQNVTGPGADFRREDNLVQQLWVNVGGLITPGWRYTVRVHASGYEAPTLQPVNRYQMGVRSEHVELAVGDVNPAFHELILAGRRVRGVQAGVRAGPAQLTVVTGDSRRAIDGVLDPLDPTRVGQAGTFGQSLIAVRPALGRGRLFQAGLTLMRVRDDVGSIPDLRTAPVGDGGLTQGANPLPKDNLVVGGDVTARLFSGRLTVQYHNAMSLLANDISAGPLTGAQLDSVMEERGYSALGLEPERFERYFTLNASLIPLDPRGLSSLAHQLRSSVHAGGHMLTAEWFSIGGSYHTLGYPALQRDRQGIRVRDSFTLFRHALAVSAGFEEYRDNLEEIKPTTTSSRGLFADMNWQSAPNRPGLAASVRMGTRENDLAPGEISAVDETNLALSLGLILPLPLTRRFQTALNLNASILDRDDAANPLAGSRNLYYLAGIQAHGADRRSGFGVHYGLNQSELTGVPGASTDFHRVAANVRVPLADRWTATLDGIGTAARSPDDAGALGLRYDRQDLMAGSEFEWMPTFVVVVTAGMTSYTDHLFPARDTRELVARVRLSRTF